jgi:hypothetical protein
VATSDPFLAKRALFALLEANNGPAQALDGIQVSYSYPAAIEDRCIYGGGVRFDHVDAVAATPGVLVNETASVGVYVHVVGRGRTQEENDQAANAIGVAILALIKASPTFAAAGTWMGLGRGDQAGGGLSTYEATNDEVITLLGYQFSFGRAITY